MVTKICSVKFEGFAMTCGLSDPRSIWICSAAGPLKAFLPRANGEVGRGSVGKGNFVKLRKAVSLDDQIITEEKTQMESILFDHFYSIEFVLGSQIRRAFSRRLLDRPLNIRLVVMGDLFQNIEDDSP